MVRFYPYEVRCPVDVLDDEITMMRPLIPGLWCFFPTNEQIERVFAVVVRETGR